jgi:hypothetical protein
VVEVNTLAPEPSLVSPVLKAMSVSDSLLLPNPELSLKEVKFVLKDSTAPRAPSPKSLVLWEPSLIKKLSVT